MGTTKYALRDWKRMTSSVAASAPQALQDILAFENRMLSYPGGMGRDAYLEEANAWYTGEALDRQETRWTAAGPEEQVDFWPLRLNYGKAIVDKLCHLLWGQWQLTQSKHLLVPMLRPRKRDRGVKAWEGLADACEEFLHDTLFIDNDGDRILFQGSLDGGRMGTTVFQIGFDPAAQVVPISVISPTFFKCRWNWAGQVTDAITIQDVPIEEAAGMGWQPSPQWRSDVQRRLRTGDIVSVWEHWTPQEHSRWADDVLLQRVENPFGFIPFVIIPNVAPSDEFYGRADTDGVKYLIKELNTVMADTGDAINYYAHPIPVIIDAAKGVENLALGPGQVWDIQTRTRSESQAQAKFLAWDGPSPDTLGYIKEILSRLDDLSYVPRVAYGVPMGTQQSGIALQVEMLPATDLAGSKRIFWAAGLRTLLRMILRVGAMYSLISAPRSEYATWEHIRRLQVDIGFAPMLPRDDSALTNKNIALVTNRLKSRVAAIADIGENSPEEELERIYQDWEQDNQFQVGSLFPKPLPPAQKPLSPGSGQPEELEEADNILQE